MEQNMNMGTQMPEKKPVGATVGIILIVLVLAFGAYYFLKQVPAPTTEAGTPTSAEVQADQVISSLSTQGTSTDLADIQKDLDSTNFSGIDAGLSDIII
ncbi:MAG: hypothetical protein AAB770_00885 [Patescibacteria group bacterium]